MADLKEHLTARNLDFAELANGDIFFRRSDGQGMYIRPFGDDRYDWSVNAARNDSNLMETRAAQRHELTEVLQRVDDFLGLVVSGRVVIDTLGMVRRSMELGMPRKEAERIAVIARNFALDMHNSGMDAEEIKARFGEIHEQLRRERLGHSEPAAPQTTR